MLHAATSLCGTCAARPNVWPSRSVAAVLLDTTGRAGNQRAIYQSYLTLGLDPSNPRSSEPDVVKEAYVRLCRRLHPDTGGAHADARQLAAVQQAYRIVSSGKADDERIELEEFAEKFDIRHTAPQHRRYLEYGGHGSGTPSERQRQHVKRRAADAHHASSDYMFRKAYSNDAVSDLVMQTEEEKEYARRWKSRNAIERLVEDLIQESMNKGDFDNLKGAGKPLPHDTTYNPYLDTMTTKINQILVHNGFSPEWILMEKEIREGIADLRSRLLEHCSHAAPRAEEEAALQHHVLALNKHIDAFNLRVPVLTKQMVHIDWDREIARAQNGVTPESTVAKRIVKEPIETVSEPAENRSSTFAYLLDVLSGIILRRLP